jgi:hypothetical protein
MPQMGFEPTTTVLERTKTFHVLDRAPTAIGFLYAGILDLYRYPLSQSSTVFFVATNAQVL